MGRVVLRAMPHKLARCIPWTLNLRIYIGCVYIIKSCIYFSSSLDYESTVNYPPLHTSNRRAADPPAGANAHDSVCFCCAACPSFDAPVRRVHRSRRETLARGWQAGGHATPRRCRPQASGRSHIHPEPAGSARASRRGGHLYGKGSHDGWHREACQVPYIILVANMATFGSGWCCTWRTHAVGDACLYWQFYGRESPSGFLPTAGPLSSKLTCLDCVFSHVFCRHCRRKARDLS